MCLLSISLTASYVLYKFNVSFIFSQFLLYALPLHFAVTLSKKVPEGQAGVGGSGRGGKEGMGGMVKLETFTTGVVGIGVVVVVIMGRPSRGAHQ